MVSGLGAGTVVGAATIKTVTNDTNGLANVGDHAGVVYATFRLPVCVAVVLTLRLPQRLNGCCCVGSWVLLCD
jgi:hypothetical protein